MHSLSAIIRPFQERDIPIAAAMAKGTVSYPWSEDVFRDCLKAHYHAWILELEKPIGFLVLLEQADVCELLMLCVDKDYQRRGYGQQLLAHAIVFAESEHFSRINLEVRVSNKTAISVYHAAGFIDVGMRKKYYPRGAEEREDALLMTLSCKKLSAAR